MFTLGAMVALLTHTLVVIGVVLHRNHWVSRLAWWLFLATVLTMLAQRATSLAEESGIEWVSGLDNALLPHLVSTLLLSTLLVEVWQRRTRRTCPACGADLQRGTDAG